MNGVSTLLRNTRDTIFLSPELRHQHPEHLLWKTHCDLHPSLLFFFSKRGRYYSRLIFLSLCVFYFCFGHTSRHAGSWFPDQGSNLSPSQCKLRVLTIGPPGKSPFTSQSSQTFRGGPIFVSTSDMRNCVSLWREQAKSYPQAVSLQGIFAWRIPGTEEPGGL